MASISIIRGVLSVSLIRFLLVPTRCTGTITGSERAKATATSPSQYQDSRQKTAGLSGIFGPDTFIFPRKEAILQDGYLAVAPVDLSSTQPSYPTNVTRRKDLVLMRQPHHYLPLVMPDGKTDTQ